MDDYAAVADDVNSVKNDELRALFASTEPAALTGSPRFEYLLRRAVFVAPVYARPAPGGTAFRFRLVRKLFGGQYIPVFTDMERLNAWGGEPGRVAVKLSFDEISRLLRIPSVVGGVCVNPGCESALIPLNMIARVDGSLMPKSFRKDETVMLGEPKEYPNGIDDAMRRYLAARPEVSRAYFCLMIRGDFQSYLLVVDCDGDALPVFEGAADAAAEHLDPGGVIDFAVASSEFGKAVTRGRRPFYRKDSVGRFERFIGKRGSFTEKLRDEP